MQLDRYRVTLHNHGTFRLDGGAMFGTVPKPLWEKGCPPDEHNRILLATTSLVIESDTRMLIVDLGCGDKMNEKNRSIFELPDTPYSPVEGVTDVLLTHFHFDHAGGVSSRNQGELSPNYPNARHYASKANLENARNPNLRERTSYLPENVNPLDNVELIQTQAGQEIWPGLTVHEANGHTQGLQWVKLTDGGTTIVFPADLIPTSKHLPIPYVMGYDVCAITAMKEKEAFLRQAALEEWIVIFEHDPEIPAGRIRLDEKDRPYLSEPVAL